MKRTKYFQLADSSTASIKRVKNGRVEYFCSGTLPGWNPSHYNEFDLTTGPNGHRFRQLTRDQARKLYPKAFR